MMLVAERITNWDFRIKASIFRYVIQLKVDQVTKRMNKDIKSGKIEGPKL